jgi:hypothetical protein
MKKYVLPVAVLALVLAACGEKPAPATGDATADKPKAEAPATAAAKPKPPVAGKPLAQPMPQGVVLNFPYHFRSDRIEQAKNGKNQRLILVESMAGTINQTSKALRESLKAAGFRPVTAAKDVPTDADGSQRFVFVKKGWDGSVTAVLAPKGERTLRNKASTATITFIWDDPALAGATPTPAKTEAEVPADAEAAPAAPAAQ